MRKIGYEETDKKIEVDIYGIGFEIKIKENNIEELRKIDKNDKDIIRKTIELILGKGSVEKINKKRKEDGYDEIDVVVGMTILTFILDTYSEEMSKNTVERYNKTYENINKRYSQYNRGYNRNYRR